MSTILNNCPAYVHPKIAKIDPSVVRACSISALSREKSAECLQCANYCDTFGEFMEKECYGIVDIQAENDRMNGLHRQNMVN